MANACALPSCPVTLRHYSRFNPSAVAGTLMSDAHLGYDLPIGGVLATDNAVIPHAVGVDIECRTTLTVYDRKANALAGQRNCLANLIESEMHFDLGCEFEQRRERRLSL